MRVMRVDENGEATYELRGMSTEQAETLGALADFPLWGGQPEKVAIFCAALHGAVREGVPNPWPDGPGPDASAHGMTPNTTVDLN